MSKVDSTSVRRSFKFRLYPNANQARELEAALETHRRLWNECLGLINLAWEQYRASVNYFDCSRWFTAQRKINPFYARLNYDSAGYTMQRLHKAFKAFFRRVKAGQPPGYPRFKGKEFFNSIEYKGVEKGVKLIGSRLRIQNVGMVRVKLHRPIEGNIKTVRVKREAGKWFVIFSCDLGPVAIPKSTLPAIGIDVGLESFLTTSDGAHELNPRYLKDALPELRIAQRAVSRKKRGGSNRRKAAEVVQKVHARVSNLRRDHHYKVAHRLVLAYGLIAVESLNVQGMLKSRRFSRAISDAGWFGFLSVLRHKAAKAGARVVDVNCRGTSQECSGCGAKVRKKLSEREHVCTSCGLVLHRDVNAAKVILARGLARIGPAGLNVGAQGQACSEKPAMV